MEGNYKKWINRFNSKQDTLTEDNLGQFMDSELDTKSIPTSGDIILGRDTLNGKAVKIPINKLAFKSDIDNLQIGGRNYFTKSNLEYGARSITTGQIVTASNTYIRTKEPISLEDNKNYILTTINKGIGNWTYDILLIKWDGTFFGLIQIGKDADFFVPQGVTTIHINIRDNGNPLNLEWFNANINVKIEKGNKATDWTPAPEDKQDRLQDITGNIGVGKPDASATEKLEVNGNVKANGFKTPTGTATQGLRADGGVFDLTTKADLENGKIPATQLPSYVDDVLEFANLAYFPATGESGKIYIAIDTNLTYRWGGSSYVVMSSSLALGETSSTAFRGDYGSVAYDHSQATGNLHDTKLEELTDVSGDATSIVDTDVILKKEVVEGFWRKITWGNIKASLKTYFDSLYAPKLFNVKVTTPSSWVTGTTSETEVLRIEIPANSLSASDMLRIPFLMINKVGTNGTIQIKGRMSTSTTMPSGFTDQLFQTANASATNQYVGLDRSFIIDDGKLKGFPSGNTSYESSVIAPNPILQKPFDRTVTNYLYISIILSNSADKARLEGMQLTN